MSRNQAYSIVTMFTCGATILTVIDKCRSVGVVVSSDVIMDLRECVDKGGFVNAKMFNKVCEKRGYK